jgi:hypothetical protein
LVKIYKRLVLIGGQNMAKKVTEEQMARSIWLNYYNNYLFEHGAITEDERNKMAIKIYNKCNSFTQQ